MFWGLIMEPKRRYSQVVKKAFHISMAALDISMSGNEPTQVMCGYGGRNYLLCTLKKSDVFQVPLDLSFDVGTEVSFATNGESHVHLTGYLLDEDQLNLEEGEEEQEEEETIQNDKKRSKKASTKEGPPNKKSKTRLLLDNTLDSHDDSDDSDVNLSDLLEESAEESDGDESSNFEEEEEEGLSEEEEDVSSLSDEEEKKPKQKQNGVASKKEKKADKKKQVEEKKKDKRESNVEKKEKDTTKSPGKQGTPQKKTVEGGVVIEDIKIGNGPAAKSGNFLTVYYEGRLKSNNKMFDSATKGPGFKFRLGKREVIKGWDVGLVGMKVGGKRKITCPPHMAYGPKGSPPIVPPSATLVFEVELKNAQ